MKYIIETGNLTKRYGSFTALNQVNLKVGQGEIYGLVGDNGAGKTTFLKLLTGHIFPSDGEIALFGAYTQKDMEKQRKRTGAIIEQPGFYPQLTVEQNLEYCRIQKGIPGRQIVKEVRATVGLVDKSRKKGRELSLGMKQRLGLAIALMGEPELLLLDEPINGLDPSGIVEIRNLLLKLNQEKNMTIVLSSHILPELEHLATVYGFLNQGCLMEQITAEKLYEKCSHYVEIAVTDAERYTALLEKELKHTDYRVMPDHTVHILNPRQELISYSSLAGEHGIGVSRLDLRKQSLEEYYMKLKEGGKKVC